MKNGRTINQTEDNMKKLIDYLVATWRETMANTKEGLKKNPLNNRFFGG